MKKKIFILLIFGLFVSACYSQNAYGYLKDDTPYIQPYDTDMLMQQSMLMQERADQNRRAQYKRADENRRIIQNMANELFEWIEYFNITNEGLTAKQKEYVKWANKQIAAPRDYSNNTVALNVHKWLVKQIEYVESWELTPSIEEPKEIIYSGVVSVFSYVPILDKPDAKGGTEIYRVKKGKVNILHKEKGRYYKVQAEGIIGYLDSFWIKTN